jgi:2,4-dienoyl-CoA reductase-like NADH-dependent reductase (Old Yellow Enzyme family)
MTPATLFTPFRLGKLDLANRIVIGPMCQYSADNGQMNDWHLMHLGHLAASGAALLIIEATAVTPEGRITDGDSGLYSDDCEEAMARVLHGIRTWSDMPIGIQLSHAGRKASRRKPWHGDTQILPTDPNGWVTVAPSALAARSSEVAPTALTRDGMIAIRDAFAAAARRASHLGLDLIQLHAAHGYLLHGFLSPLSNTRDDDYGGSLENRMRFPLEIFEAVRDAFRADRPVTVRVSATDWVEGGWSVDDTIAFIKALEAKGCDGIDASSGGASVDQRIQVGPGYQVPLARALKQSTSTPITALGLITEYDQAEAILQNGDADLIGLARGMLFDPRWPWHAAAYFGAQVTPPKQYLRSEPAGHRDLFVRD